MSNPSAELPTAPAARFIPPRFTPSETKVLELLSRGTPNREIAEILGTTRGSVQQHIHRIGLQLRLSGRLQIGLWAARYFVGGLAA